MKLDDLTLNDYDAIVDLWHRVGFKLSQADERESIARFLDRNPGLCLVMRENKRIVATILGGDDGRRGYIHHLAVDPKYQKRGLGRQLFQELIQRFRARGLTKVHGFILQTNRQVVDFYKKFGATLRDDIIMMSLDLSPSTH
jgi:ribosomal protein S18 acetylase RimI-like enzyme